MYLWNAINPAENGMHDTHIGFIGGGNMARSLIGGLLADGFAAERLHVADPNPDTTSALASQFGIRISPDNQTLLSRCAVVVLAVKPQVLKQVCTALDTSAHADTLFISIAAGIRSTDIDRWLGGERALVRTMPNTPALVQSGATALYATARVNATQRDRAESILRAVGLTLWLNDEVQMDAVTALSGSGPAYFFLVMEAMERAGHELGLSSEAARLLTLQTAFGAAKMALESDNPPAELRRRVTSPGGTTERAVQSLQAGGLESLFTEALRAARDRAVALADELGK